MSKLNKTYVSYIERDRRFTLKKFFATKIIQIKRKQLLFTYIFISQKPGRKKTDLALIIIKA